MCTVSAAFGKRVALGGLWKFGYQASVFVNVFCIRELLNGLAAEPVDGQQFWWAGLLLAPTMGVCQFGQSVYNCASEELVLRAKRHCS